MGRIIGTSDSTRWYAKVMVLLFLGTMAGGFFGELYVPSKLIVAGDAAATAHNIQTSGFLFRLGFAGYLVEAICDIALAWMFYLLLRPVNRELALLAAFFGLVSTATFASAESFYLAVASILGDSGSLGSFSPDQRHGLAMLSLKFYSTGAGVFMVFYGVASAIRGYLIFRSGYLPAFVGTLFMIAGAGFITRSFLLVLYPQAASEMLLAPMFPATLSLMAWLIVKGANVPEGQLMPDKATLAAQATSSDNPA